MRGGEGEKQAIPESAHNEFGRMSEVSMSGDDSHTRSHGCARVAGTRSIDSRVFALFEIRSKRRAHEKMSESQLWGHSKGQNSRQLLVKESELEAMRTHVQVKAIEPLLADETERLVQ